MTVKPGALKPGKTDRHSLSLIRARIGCSIAKTAAIENVHGSDFVAFGASGAEELAGHCDALRDDRETFFGHAEMDLGYEIPAGPPNTPPGMSEVYEMAIARLVALSRLFVVHPDPNPGGESWALVSESATVAPGGGK